MKKIYLLLFLLITSNSIWAQTSTEFFETESVNSASFTDNGVIFNIMSQSSTFGISLQPNAGWNGTANDNRFIDNLDSQAANASFSIKTTTNLFKVNKFWVFLAGNFLNQNVNGTLTITGKLSGITKFTQTKTNGFATSLGATNGYTPIDLTNLNGQNYSNIVIDELRITAGGDYIYLGLDAFTWVKDSNIVSNCVNISSQPSNSTICPGSNTTFSASSFDATGYQWQVNTGSGYTNLSNGGVYSGVTTSTLSITGATTAMNNYQYQLVASGSCGSSVNSNPATLRINSPLSFTAQPSNRTVCSGSNTTISIGAANAIGYQWKVNTGSGFTNITNGGPYLGANTASLSINGVTSTMNNNQYQCEVTGCTNSLTSNSVILAVPQTLTSNFQSQSNVSTYGGNNGSATVGASGGTTPYFYSWSPIGVTTATASNLSAGIYTVTITDSTPNGLGGCATTQDVIITQPPGATVSFSSLSPFSACTGSASNAQSFTVNAGGLTANLSLSAPTGFQISADAGGNGTYSTNLDIIPSSGIVNRTIYVRLAANATGTPSGDLTVSSTGIPSKTIALTGTVNQVPTITAQPSSVAICSGGNATFSVAASNATTYKWQLDQGQGSGFLDVPSSSFYSGINTSTLIINGAPATFNGYKFRVIATGSCTPVATSNAATLNVNLISVLTSKTDVACFGSATGIATASGGVGEYTYSWSNGKNTATITDLVAGTYTVTVSDQGGCSKTESVTIGQPSSAITLTAGTVTNVSCNGGANGIAEVIASGGGSGFTYSWNTIPTQSTAKATGLSAGTYTVTVTDANTCQTTKSFTISQPTALSTLTGGSHTDVSCNGGSNGTATVEPTGGTPTYTYSWNTNPVQVTATATGLSMGTYTVTVTDANACQATRTFTIGQPAILSASKSSTDVLCNGTATGSATVTPTGGIGTYTYIWSPTGGTAATATGLTTGNYDCLITDANGCSLTESFFINQPTTLYASTSQINATCSTGGEASVFVSGGVAPYSYLWTPGGATTSTVNNLAAGNYSCRITDGNGCSITRNFTITTTNTLVASSSKTDLLCNGTNTGSASVVPSGAPGPFTYVWSPSGGNGDTAINLAAGNYSVTITAGNGCSIVKNFTINEPPAIVITKTGQTNVSCPSGSNGSLSVAVTGGTGAYTYSWTPSGGTASTATGLATGTYTLTVKDANGCVKTQNYIITQPAALSPSISKTDISCNGGSNGSATVSVTGGTGAYTYSWAPTGGTAATASGLSAGNYIVTIKDANLCQTTASVLIGQPDLLNATSSKTDVSCLGAADGTATVNATGGTGTYTYLWAPSGGTASTATGLTPGTYTATITDANGCFVTKTVTIITTPDVTAPIPSVAVLPEITNYCAVLASQIEIPTAIDNCIGLINATTTDPLNYNTPGTYTIAWKYDDGNGNITTQPQTVKVFESPIKAVTFNDAEFTYDGNPHSIEVANLPTGATVSYTTNNGAINVGTYTITVTITPAITAPNCSPIVLTANLIITKASLNITANAQTKVYGSTDPELTYVANGFANGDNASILTGTLIRVDGENVGTYTINQGTLNANNNYNIIYTSDKLTITPKAFSVIANAQTKVYGTTDPALTYVSSGFTNGDTANIITGTLTRTNGENTGAYDINQGTLSAGNNYTISYTSDKLTITPKTLTVFASAHTKVYGSSDPVFNYTPTGFANGDTNTIISGQLSRDTGENVGKYNINLGTLNVGLNYVVVFTGAEFEITKADQTITWNQVLEFGCDDSTVIKLEASTDSGLPVSYTVANPLIGTIAEANFTILNSGSTTITASQSGDQNHNPATMVLKPIEISQGGLITQQWADVLFFDNKTDNFTAWQWYKNGSAVSGANRQYYNENQAINGTYYVIATNKDGNSIKSCPIEITGAAFSKSLKIHPNPVRPMSEFTIECDFSESQLNGSEITIFDITGKLVQTISNVKPQNQIIAPTQSAIYVVVLSLNNGQKKTINLLVK
jgi:predicted secreted protein